MVLIILTLVVGIARTLVNPRYAEIPTELSPSSHQDLLACHGALESLSDQFSTHLFTLTQAIRTGDESRVEAWREELRVWREDLESLAARCLLTKPEAELSPTLRELAVAYRSLRELDESYAQALREFAEQEQMLMSRTREALSRAKAELR